MAGIASQEAGNGRSLEGLLSGQRCQSGEALAEWRSSEQVEYGIPSTSPPYWDTDDDDDGGPKPSELYGKYTWKIEKFSHINKRELRSNAFEVGGYKWYILIYPQGCDVCNHLSLFLCVANHDKLLPGWGHFAQFTIAVVNKDPKKSKYSDTLHRFWKKEHDWGWKKFMELSKVSDGFLDAADTLVIKAQVQVIREKADRPFRCLDCQYRRELVRVYLTNVEQICRRFVEERRGKLGRLIEDKDMWSSFRDFWVGMDRNTRRGMSREKSDVILKVVVKHFFIEKEVTSTLVMDSLYSGLKALESQSKSKKGRAKLLESEEIPAPIVCADKDTFILVDDVLRLIERAAMEPLPLLPPKDEKGLQNRTKDGNLGEEFNKDSIERDERRLTELGRRTVEIFILAHIFNHKIEAAYQEAVALKRQEELIREEEMAAWLESDQKLKRGVVEKEKKAKKKQGKQKRNNKKGKDKGREDRTVATVIDKQEEICDGIKDSLLEEVQAAEEKSDIPEDASDVSDSVDGGAEVLQPDSEDRDASPVNWDTDTSEAHPHTETSSTGASTLLYGTSEKRRTSVMDDSSSTCSTDSVPSTVMNSPYRGSSNYQCERSPSRGKSQRGKATCNGSWDAEIDNQPSGATANGGDQDEETASSKVNDCDTEFAALHDRTIHGVRLVKKDEEVTEPQSRPSTKVPVDEEPITKEKIIQPSSPQSSQPSLPATTQLKPEIKIAANGDYSHVKKASPGNSNQADKAATFVTSVQSTTITKSEVHNGSTLKIPERPAVHQGAVSSRPSSAPVVPGPRPVVAPVVSMAQDAPLLARSVSAVGRLGPDPLPTTHSYARQSYRNAISGNSIGSSSSGFPHNNQASSGVNQLLTSAHSSALVSAPMFLPINSDGVDPASFGYGMLNRNSLYSGPQWMDSSQRVDNRTMLSDRSPPVMNGFQNFELYKPFNSSRSREKFSVQTPTLSSGRPSQGVVTDDFPHLDIINDLLDDEYGIGSASGEGRFTRPYSNGPQFLNRQFSMPCDSGVSADLGSSSTSSSCRFERTRSYQDGGGLRRSYGQYDSLREFVPQAAPLTYTNGHMDGMIPSHWQMAGSDILVGMMNPDGETSPYYGPDYSSLACGVNGYPFYRPSNGH